MSLQSLIQQGNYESAQAAYEAITTPVETLNTKAWTVADLTKEFPPTELNDLNTMLGTMESVPVFRSAFIALSITGLEFASAERQQLIDTLAVVGQWTAELTQKVKRLGRPLKAPWQTAGITEPTLEDVHQVFDSVVLANDWSTLQNEVINPASNQRATLIAALRQAADALEA